VQSLQHRRRKKKVHFFGLPFNEKSDFALFTDFQRQKEAKKHKIQDAGTLSPFLNRFGSLFFHFEKDSTQFPFHPPPPPRNEAAFRGESIVTIYIRLALVLMLKINLQMVIIRKIIGYFTLLEFYT
jgi:hypothetical protein